MPSSKILIAALSSLLAIAPVAGAGSPEDPPRAQAGTEIRIYSADLEPSVFGRVNYGFDRDAVCTVSPYGACTTDADCSASANDVCGVSIDSLTSGTQTNAWDLVCDPVTPGGSDCQITSWDFSGFSSTAFTDLVEFGTTSTPIDNTETCSSGECGFSTPGAILGRDDRDFDGTTPRSTLNAVEIEDRKPQDVTHWLRSAVRNEGVSDGGIGQNESRICYVTGDRNEVPLFQFQHCDATECYMQVGDVFRTENPATGNAEAFQCENTIFNHVCPNSCGIFCELYAHSCSGFSGTQDTTVVNQGNITLPSGHTFEALVMNSNAEFCLGLFSTCGSAIETVRTVTYLWEVANLGTVARMMSRNTADSVQDFNAGDDVAAEVDIKFGLFPPLSVTVGTITDTTVDLSWNPGLETGRIDGYRIYWDTDSGGTSGYAFDSMTNVLQATIVGTTATITGLTPGTQYYFTVNATSNYTDPSSNVTTAYESLLYPKQIPAVPTPLPLEVPATTTGGGCAPSQEITGLTVGKSGTFQEFCWTATADGCVDGYRILGASTPESDLNFSIVESDTGLITCTTIDPTESYFLVIGKGGGTGPWGHFGL